VGRHAVHRAADGLGRSQHLLHHAGEFSDETGETFKTLYRTRLCTTTLTVGVGGDTGLQIRKRSIKIPPPPIFKDYLSHTKINQS
jgi:hypothetical protein